MIPHDKLPTADEMRRVAEEVQAKRLAAMRTETKQALANALCSIPDAASEGRDYVYFTCKADTIDTVREVAEAIVTKGYMLNVGDLRESDDMRSVVISWG